MKHVTRRDTNSLHTIAKTVRVLVVLAVIIAIAVMQLPDPTVRAREDSEGDIDIAYEEGNHESWLINTLYQNALNRAGRKAKPTLQQKGNNDPIDQIFNRSADLYVGCAGDLLERINPAEAHALAEEYATATQESINQGEWREKVYHALLTSLPGGLSGADPSNAIACEDSEIGLPQNLVPIYNVSVFDRNARLVLNSVSGTISTEDLNKLIEDANQESSSVNTIVNTYLADNKL